VYNASSEDFRANVRAEICDETNESRAFSLFPVMLNVGTLIASFVGGEYANVGRHYPNFANNFPIFKTYPYLLPCLIAGIFPLLSALTAAIWLEETLPPIALKRDDEAPEAPEPLSDIFTPKINKIMFSSDGLGNHGHSSALLLYAR
jgi:hypothetical protein